jgi:hypothetical protein
MADEEATTELIQFFFPWLDFKDLPKLNTREAHVAGVNASTALPASEKTATAVVPSSARSLKSRMRDPLSPEVRGALEELYSEEIALYSVAKRVHKAQVEYVRSQRD